MTEKVNPPNPNSKPIYGFAVATNEIYPEPKTYEQATIESLLASCKQALQECDALRAELAQERNERDATADMLRALRAENERLRLIAACYIEQEKEVMRLRAALEEIADVAHPPDMRSVNIARQALGRGLSDI